MLHAVCSSLILAATLMASMATHAADKATHDADDDAKAEQAAPKSKKARGAAPLDPMQDLRERLAAKLGATKAPESKEETAAVRVSTQPDGELRLTATTASAPR